MALKQMVGGLPRRRLPWDANFLISSARNDGLAGLVLRGRRGREHEKPLSLMNRRRRGVLYKAILSSSSSSISQVTPYLLNLGKFHRLAGIPSDYLGVMGSMFLHAVRPHLEAHGRWGISDLV